MYLLTINLYELGQFLRIVLWIFLPIVILSMLVTTWLHYRRKGREQGGLLLAVEGFGRLPEESPIRASEAEVIANSGEAAEAIATVGSAGDTDATADSVRDATAIANATTDSAADSTDSTDSAEPADPADPAARRMERRE